MEQGKTERIKLTITHVDQAKEYKPGKFVLNFKAKGADGKELRYGCFSKSLIELIKVDTEVEADVETKTKDFDGEPRTERTVKQVYVNGNPVEAKGFGGSGKQWGKSAEALAQELLISREHNQSIESQVALKEVGECIRTGIEVPAPLKGQYFKALEVKLEAFTGAKAPNPTEVKTAHKALPASASDPDGLFSEDRKPTIPEFKTGSELFNAALKAGHSLEAIREVAGTNKPNDIKVEELPKIAKKLFGGK